MTASTCPPPSSSTAGVRLATLVCAIALCATASATDVQRWAPYDAAFTVTEPTNPFAQDFSATVTGPGGISFTTPGFFDGNGTWKIRVAPYSLGTWTVTTISSNAALSGKTASINCVANANAKVHGGLRIDAQHPNHFLYEDGSRYYLLGYEANWLWAVDMQTSPLSANVTTFLDQVLVANGFNHVMINAYAYNSDWGTGSATDYGPPALRPWPGTVSAPDYTRFTLAYWQHYDQVMEALRQRGIVAHLMARVYNKHVVWPANGSAGDNQYWTWLVARYGAFPNTVWDFSKEAQNESDKTYIRGRLAYIKSADPYHRLRTVHDDDGTYASYQSTGSVEFHTDQNHGNWHSTILTQRAANWPVYNEEYGYEEGAGGTFTYGVHQPAEEVMRRAWQIAMAGGYAGYYYTWTAWDDMKLADRPPGYAYFHFLSQFFTNANYWNLQPADNLVNNGGYCLADPGKEYYVYQANSSPFTLTITAALPAQWYNIRTGATQSAGNLVAGANNLTPPAGWNEVALRAGGPAFAGGGGNLAPSVMLTAPANGATYPAPATVALTASASDSDGTVALVEFFQGATKIGEDASSPYAFTWSNIAAGSYTLTAKATDNLGATTTSSAVTITVAVAVVAPAITTQPTNQTVTAGQTATFPVVASGSGPLTYLWKRGTTTVGGNSSTLTIVNAQAADAGSYTVSVSNTAGSATSNAATLVVNSVTATPPVVAAPASSPTAAITGVSAPLSVLGGPAGSEPGYTYTWSVVTAPAGGAATFSTNGSNAARNATITFNRVGIWQVQVVIANPANGSATVSGPVTMSVIATLTSVVVTGPVAVTVNASAQFTAQGRDQFAQALATQPAYTWTATVGTVGGSGLFTAPAATGSGQVTAASGGKSGQAGISITAAGTGGGTTGSSGKKCGFGAGFAVGLIGFCVAARLLKGRN